MLLYSMLHYFHVPFFYIELVAVVLVGITIVVVVLFNVAQIEYCATRCSIVLLLHCLMFHF